MKKILILLSLSIPGFIFAQGINKASYNDFGKLSTTCIGEDEGNYKFTTYHENGLRASMGRFKDGEKHGIWKTWDSNGQLQATAHYSNGEKTGKWIINEPDHTSFEISFSHNHMTHAFKKDDHGHIVAKK